MADKDNARSKKYINLGFTESLKDLTDFSKIFFPKTSKDFSDSSSGEMMLEQAAFVTDVLSYYIEDRFKNSNIVTAKDIRSVFIQAQALGYPLQGPRAASGVQNFYLEVPATTGSFNDSIPDMRYALNAKRVQLQNSNGIVFEALDDIDFSKVNISSSLESKVSRRANNGSPSHFVIKRTGVVSAGQTKTEEVIIGDYKAFRTIELSEPNVLDIVSVVDSDGDEWFEVDYLAREAIFEAVRTTNEDSQNVPFTLKLKTVPKRFTKKIDPTTGKTTLKFGPGKATEIGTPFVPDPADIALDLRGKLNFSPPFIDPQNFLKTRTLGLSPFGTTLTIKSRVGGGTITNTAVNSLRDIISKEIDLNSVNLNPAELNNTLSSLSTNNDKPILGGDEPETMEEIKENASAYFAAQGRLSQREDYIAFCLSLPTIFGKVFRVHVERNNNPNAGVQLYVIAKDINGKLTAPSETLKKNLKIYLSQYARFSQGIDILPGNIANIGIEYSIVVMPGYNKTSVKLETLNKVKNHVKTDNWQLNQPFVLDDLRALIKGTEGVLSISELKIVNKNNVQDGNQYSETVFSVELNTRNQIVFCPPSSIFEVRYPNGPDIKVGAL